MSVDSCFITRSQKISAPTDALAEGYFKIAQAAEQISELGKSIVLGGSRRSGKSTFIVNQMDANYPNSGRIGRMLLRYRTDHSKGAQLLNVSFLMTDDERIPHEAVVISAAAAKPSRAFLDDDGVFFSRIFYDLIRYSASSGVPAENADLKTLKISVSKSIENYIDLSGGNSLSQWLSPNNDELVAVLSDALFAATKDSSFLSAAKMLFKYSETERNNRLSNSEHSFALFSRRCRFDNDVLRMYGIFWETLTKALCKQLKSFCNSLSCDGCCCIEDENSIRLIMITSDRDGCPEFFANHPVTNRIVSRFFAQNAMFNGNMRVPENFFSNIQYICRMNPALLDELSKLTDLGAIEVARIDGKPIHALRFIEAGDVSADGRLNDIDSIIKQNSCVGMIVFSECNQLELQPELFSDVGKVLREGSYILPTAIIRTKMELQFNNNSSFSDSSIENLSLDVSFAEKQLTQSRQYALVNELIKNRGKLRPKICGIFDCGRFPESENDCFGKMQKAGIKDESSPQFIAEVIGSILNGCDIKKAIPISVDALAKDFAEFTADSISITPNVFSTLCTSFGESAELTAAAEGAVLGKWLCVGEKCGESLVDGSPVPSAVFINSLRNVYRTYLKRFIVVSNKAAQSVSEDAEQLLKLLECNVQLNLGEFFARTVGRCCFDKCCTDNRSDAKQRFTAALKVICGEIFSGDEVTVTPENTLGRLLSSAFNDCVHDIIKKSCCVVYSE